MNENLNLLEILKDCPKETKFYSSYLGKDVLFTAIYDNCIECEYPSQSDSSNCIIQFRQDGSLYTGGECMLFPSKDQRDWSKWHRPFKDGDILAYMFWCKPTIYIYREGETHNTSYYVAYSSVNNKLYTDAQGALAGNRNDLRFATEEEKQKLYSAIREKGYKWNSETKTLEKLIEQKFKIGDVIISKNGLQIYNITDVTSEYYSVKVQDCSCVGLLSVKDQDDWILLPSKFDPKTLKPFDKVLVRDIGCNTRWHIQFFETMYENEKKYPFVCLGGKIHSYCIPYAGNEHLLNTINEPSEFYRYWEN